MFSLNNEGIHAPSARVLGDEIFRQSNTKFDYVKYRQAIQGLLGLKMDPEMARISTLTTAKTMGVEKEEILQSAKHFIELLTKEQDKFNIALQSQYSLRVEKLMSERIQAGESLENKKKMIEQLYMEIDELKSKVSELEKDIQEGQSFIDEKRQLFENTVSVIKDLISKDIQTLEK